MSDEQAWRQAIEQQLTDGAQRMDRMQQELSDNTAVTVEVRDYLVMGRAGLRVLGALGAVASWLGKIAVAVGAVWGAVYAIKNGAPPHK
jgi:hypothetical protein